MSELTKARLCELFEFDELTGEFVRRVSRGGSAKAGTVAGHLHSDGYHQIKIDGRLYLRARLVILYIDEILLRPDQLVDHLNRVRNDDRRANLRITDRTWNASGARGVFWHKREGKWKPS